MARDLQLFAEQIHHTSLGNGVCVSVQICIEGRVSLCVCILEDCGVDDSVGKGQAKTRARA